MQLNKFSLLLILSFVFLPQVKLIAQREATSDELYQEARSASTDKQSYRVARELCKLALAKSPNYTDISILLARIYSWDKMYDSARAVLTDVLIKNPSSLEALSALIDLEIWSGNLTPALNYVNLALAINPLSEDALIKKMKILTDLHQYEQASKTIESILRINPKNVDAFIFAEKIKDLTRFNSISFSTDYEHFNKVLEPWRSSSISYSRRMSLGSVIGRFNTANRFSKTGTQGEMDVYYHFTSFFYSYFNYGYSSSDIFPGYRLGLSLFFSLPLGYEIDAGTRYLKFPLSKANIYTFAVGKYYSNYWFSFRTFIIPKPNNITSSSYTLLTRYYLSNPDNYFTLSLGMGKSPDERNLMTNPELLKSIKVGLDFQYRISKYFTLTLTTGYTKEEYLPQSYRDRILIGFGTQLGF